MTSTADPDYWSLLGLGPEADADQLKRAFRREARRWHPDLNGNDPVAEERFKLVNEAYAVLSDPAAGGPGSRAIEKDGLIETHLNKGSQISRTISRWCLASRRVGLRRPLPMRTIPVHGRNPQSRHHHRRLPFGPRRISSRSWS